MGKIDPSRIRNVGILGHGGVGKTTLVEAILHRAGVIPRVGSIESGNTVSDYLEEEIQHQHTISMKLTHFDWHDARIHLVDHPGFADFVGEVAASTSVLDGVVVLVDASTGVQVGTDNAIKYADLHKVPRAFFVNKLDRDNTDFAAIVAKLRDAYGKQCVPLAAPLGVGAGMSGVVNIFDGDIGAIAEEAARMKEEMIDAVAETDDELLAKYLETGELTPEEFRRGLHDGITAGKIMPILAGCVSKGFGLDELLDLIAESFPSPVDRHVIVFDRNDNEVELEVSADAPFLGQVFHSAVDPYVGHLTYFRVLTGTLKSDSEFVNHTRGVKERTGKILLLNGKEQEVVDAVGPGDLAAMTKLKNTHFGDTIEAASLDFEAPRITLPEAMVKLAITPKTRADEDKIGEALNKLSEEDPTFKHYRDEQTKEHIIQGVGDMQLEILLERMKNRYNVEAAASTPKVAYRETIKGRAEVQGKHKKQTGGHGQYGDVHLRVYPNERGAGYKFVDQITGGVVPKQYIPHVDKGCQEALAKGVISGNPVVDIVVELFFGSYHTVDSSEMAFKIAASMAIQKSVREADPCLLEPIMEIAVTVPEEHLGDVTGDLNSRRGRILGVDALSGGRQQVRAHVPEAEVLRYSTDLRSMTSGRGAFELHFAHYEEVPEHIAKKIVEDYEKARAEGSG